jgi:hypothetical protein
VPRCILRQLDAAFIKSASEKAQLYVALLRFGPYIYTLAGLRIQAAGQKIIAYASILAIMAQSWGALRATGSRRIHCANASGDDAGGAKGLAHSARAK